MIEDLGFQVEVLFDRNSWSMLEMLKTLSRINIKPFR
jgi:hypothetical protein